MNKTKIISKTLAIGLATLIANPLTAYAGNLDEMPETPVIEEPETPETPETPDEPVDDVEDVEEPVDEEIEEPEVPETPEVPEEQDEETIESLKAMKMALLEDIKEIEDRINEIPAEITNLEAEIEELDTEVEDYEDVKMSKEASIQVLKLEKIFKEKDLEEKKLEVEKIERQIDGLTIEELEKELKELKIEKLSALLERANKVAENDYNKVPETIEALKKVIEEVNKIEKLEDLDVENIDELIDKLIKAIDNIADIKEEKLVKRLAGANRFKTAVEVSKEVFPDGSDTVIIANGMSMVDSLTASLLAKKLDAPILLVDTNSIDKATSKEIERLGAERIVIVGGVSSVSNALEMGFKHKDITRISGKDRYETAREVAKAININADRFIVVSGRNMIDALTASSLATSQDMPILLVDEGHVKVPQSTKNVIIIGGENSVTKETEDLITTTKERISGKTRVETASIIAKRFSPEATRYVVANGETMVDALTASSLVFKYNAPILLASGDNLELPENANQVYIVGGSDSVSEEIKKDLEKQLEEPEELETPETPEEPETPVIEEPEVPETPEEKDTDGDGLSDSYEENTSKTNPLVRDTDGDGVSDAEEIENGTDPLDRHSR